MWEFKYFTKINARSNEQLTCDIPLIPLWVWNLALLLKLYPLIAFFMHTLCFFNRFPISSILRFLWLVFSSWLGGRFTCVRKVIGITSMLNTPFIKILCGYKPRVCGNIRVDVVVDLLLCYAVRDAVGTLNTRKCEYLSGQRSFLR